MNGIIAALKEVDEETREMLKEMVGSLFEIARDHKKKKMAAKRRHIPENIRHKIASGRQERENEAGKRKSCRPEAGNRTEPER